MEALVQGLRRLVGEDVAKESEILPFVEVGLLLIEKSASGILSYDLTDAGRALLEANP